MEVYYFTIFLLFIFSAIEIRKKNPAQQKFFSNLCWIPLGLIILQVGLRWEMGTDWQAYLQIFQQSAESFYDVAIEKGFLWSNYYFNQITHSYQTFIFIQAFFLYFVTLKFYKIVTPYPMIALIWFYSINLGLVGSNRQLTASFIILLGLIYYLKNNKWYFYVLFVFIAMQFHNSAIFGIFYLFFNRTVSTKILLLSLVICLMIGYVGATDFVFSYASFLGDVAKDKAEIYGKEITTYSIVAILKRIVVVVPFLIFRNKIKSDQKILNYIVNGYIFGVCIYLLFGKTFGIVATRGAYYFNIMEPVIISYYIYLLRNQIIKHLALVFVVILCIILLRQSIVQYPEIFVPYKTQFFETGAINY